MKLREKITEYDKFFTIITFLLLLIAILVALCFKNDSYGYLLEIKDYLSYAGSFGGATLGAIASFAVIILSLGEQKKQFEKQRILDNIAMDEQKQQFNKDYNLKLINQKLDTYKDIFITIEEIINKAVSINHKVALSQHLSKRNSFNQKRSIVQPHILEIEELYEISNKFNFMLIFITEKSIIDLSQEAFKILERALDEKNKCEIDETYSNNYAAYYDEIRASYVKVANELKRVSKDIYVNNIVKDMNVEYSN